MLSVLQGTIHNQRNTRKHSVTWSTISELAVSIFQQCYFVENQSDGI